ncbi:esterase-like activity of phytase family protein [Phyllobacterium sp. UNC302MFCol5.2]|uniref:esterase-like activity of phytase family protein n=1 Tax=Phyllobacterium sp. UNC302MFCol5.2 TaxID=1449065 RepID=UPI0004842225|nr:esterase-like activity of phytase family protein [Phyllobacterium sp. UNC302MFCol5.2]
MRRPALAFRRALLSAAILIPLSAQAQDEGVSPAVIKAYPISNFRIGSSETRFGALEFVGGLDLSSTNRDFGGLSAFRYLDKGGSFLGITDTGFWYAGTMERDEKGRPVGVGKFRLAPIPSEDGAPLEGKWNSDAEGMSVSGSTVTVSFERVHRIAEFDLDLENFASKPRFLPLPIPENELRSNRGIETIAYAPERGPLQGARVAVTEKSINKAGDMFAAVLEGPRKGIFYVKRIDGFDISDGDFLPNGDLLLLERRFSIASGVALRIRRIAAAAIVPGATVEGPVILDADMRYQIDNLEALDVWQAEDGSTRVSLVSDDNHSIVQRNLYLEFRLAE